MITENVSTLKIHKLTQAQYERERNAGNLDETAIYLTPDEEEYVTKSHLEETYVKKSVLERLVLDGIFIVDRVTGCEYLVTMENGKLVSYPPVVGITVTKLPDRVSYFDGGLFDPTGMVVGVEYMNGEIVEVTGYTHSEYVTGSEFTISYFDELSGKELTTTIELTIRDFDPNIDLVDFEYTSDGNGTYTLTDWKDTLNGKPSDVCIIPNSTSVKL